MDFDVNDFEEVDLLVSRRAVCSNDIWLFGGSCEKHVRNRKSKSKPHYLHGEQWDAEVVNHVHDKKLLKLSGMR